MEDALYLPVCISFILARGAPTKLLAELSSIATRCRMVQTRMPVTQASRLGAGAHGILFARTWTTFRTRASQLVRSSPPLYSVLVMMCRAVWISPVSQNYEGPRTPYGDPYHGYWISDATKLNSKFGTSDDLKALSDDLHNRGM